MAEKISPRRRGRIPTSQLADHEQEFLNDSFRLFRQHGYARVSVDMIARAARVSPKTIYARYGGKNGLFGEVIRRSVVAPLIVLDLLKNDANEDAESVLRKVASAFLDSILSQDKLDLHRMLIAEATTMPELSRLFFEEGPKKVFSILAVWLAKQNAAGVLNVRNPDEAAEVFFSLVEGGILRRALLTGELPSANQRVGLLENAIRIFTRAYNYSSKQ